MEKVKTSWLRGISTTVIIIPHSGYNVKLFRIKIYTRFSIVFCAICIMKRNVQNRIVPVSVNLLARRF